MEESKTERNFRATSVAFSERGSNETTPSPTPSAIVRQPISPLGDLLYDLDDAALLLAVSNIGEREMRAIDPFNVIE
jgi:hypothetical protein